MASGMHWSSQVPPAPLSAPPLPVPPLPARRHCLPARHHCTVSLLALARCKHRVAARWAGQTKDDRVPGTDTCSLGNALQQVGIIVNNSVRPPPHPLTQCCGCGFNSSEHFRTKPATAAATAATAAATAVLPPPLLPLLPPLLSLLLSLPLLPLLRSDSAGVLLLLKMLLPPLLPLLLLLPSLLPLLLLLLLLLLKMLLMLALKTLQKMPVLHCHRC